MADFKCIIGFHKYETLKEEPWTIAGTDVKIGTIFVLKCKNCGRLKHVDVRTTVPPI